MIDLTLGRMVKIVDDPQFFNLQRSPETWFCHAIVHLYQVDVVDITRYYLRESKHSRGRSLRLDVQYDSVFVFELQDVFPSNPDFDVHLNATEPFVIRALRKDHKLDQEAVYGRLSISQYRFTRQDIKQGGVIEEEKGSLINHILFRDNELLSIDQVRGSTSIWWGCEVSEQQVELT